MAVQNRRHNHKEGEYRSLFVLSASFTAIFTAYLAIQNLQSSLNQEKGLGIISLSCMYACIILSGILAPAILNIIGEKRSLIISFICHVIYTGTNFYPTFATLLPSSILLGLTAGPMWTSQSVYLSQKAYSYTERTGEDGHAILSRFNGIFFCMFETTQITGNLISSLVLQQGSYNKSSSNGTEFCGKDDCPIAVNTSTKIEEPDKHIVYILLSVYLVCDLVGLGLTTFLLPPSKKCSKRTEQKVLRSIIACGKGLGDLNIALLVPLFMFMAMEQAILWTDYTKSYISCPVGIQTIGFVMATYGGSTTVFALLLSRLSKYSGRRVLFAVASVVNLGTFVVLYLWKPSADYVTVIYIVPIAWGLAEGIWQTQSNALVALLFPDKTDAAFANYHTWKAVGFTITFVYSNFLCVSTKLIVAMALLVVAITLYVIVELRVHRSRQAEKPPLEIEKE